MKKTFALLLSVILLLSLCACGGEKTLDAQVSPAEEQAAPAASRKDTQPAEEKSPEADAPPPSAELTEPVMEWWELYNPNGFDTVTALIRNPNDIAVDVSYDLVFYKDGSEVSRIEYCFNESILPGHEDIIWANYDVPCSADADDVRMENVTVTETAYPPVEGSYTYRGIADGEACYDFQFDAPIEMATVWFVLYNDSNGSGRFDKGEIVVVDTDSLFEQEGTVSFETEGYAYTDCDVFFKAN